MQADSLPAELPGKPLCNKLSQFLAAQNDKHSLTQFLRVRNLGISKLACSGLSHQDVGRDHLESSDGLSMAGGFGPSLGSLTWLWKEFPVSCLKVLSSL